MLQKGKRMLPPRTLNGMNFEESAMEKISWYYYFENMTQQAIADLMGISRMRVLKLLDKARQTGVIQFKLRQGSVERLGIERQLIKAFGLKDTFVIPATPGKDSINASIAQAAAMYISERLSPDEIINIGYGDTPNRVLNNLAMMVEHPISCVSLTGGVSYYLPDTRSNVFNAKLYLMPAPLLASSKEMAVAMRQEESLGEIARMLRLASLSVVGIGAMHDSATIIKSGIMSKNDFFYLRMRGAAGDILCHFIDRKGNLVDTTMEDRLISTPLDALKEMKNVIGVAAGDSKVEAIHAVLSGKYLDVLITDEPTASKLLEIENISSD
jgi:lsr operon transcriptional repressor